ncbi:hypothetical protein PFISCL1PPCAC_11097, partial [Pristionchus fissidentatus]
MGFLYQTGVLNSYQVSVYVHHLIDVSRDRGKQYENADLLRRLRNIIQTRDTQLPYLLADENRGHIGLLETLSNHLEAYAASQQANTAEHTAPFANISTQTDPEAPTPSAPYEKSYEELEKEVEELRIE